MPGSTHEVPSSTIPGKAQKYCSHEAALRAVGKVTTPSKNLEMEKLRVLKIAPWPKAMAPLHGHIWLLDSTDVPQIAPCWNAVLVRCSAEHGGTGDTKAVSEGVTPALMFSWGDRATRWWRGNSSRKIPHTSPSLSPGQEVCPLGCSGACSFCSTLPETHGTKALVLKSLPLTNILLIPGANDLPSLQQGNVLFRELLNDENLRDKTMKNRERTEATTSWQGRLTSFHITAKEIEMSMAEKERWRVCGHLILETLWLALKWGTMLS